MLGRQEALGFGVLVVGIFCLQQTGDPITSPFEHLQSLGNSVRIQSASRCGDLKDRSKGQDGQQHLPGADAPVAANNLLTEEQCCAWVQTLTCPWQS